MAKKRRNNMEMNLPKRSEVKSRFRLPVSESPMESMLNEVMLKRGIRMEKQYPIGPFFADLAYPKIMAVIEYDGKEFHKGEQVIKDINREVYLIKNGWLVLRVGKIKHLFELTHEGKSVLMADDMEMIAESIYEIFYERGFKFGINIESRIARETKEPKFNHISNYLKDIYENFEKKAMN